MKGTAQSNCSAAVADYVRILLLRGLFEEAVEAAKIVEILERRGIRARVKRRSRTARTETAMLLAGAKTYAEEGDPFAAVEFVRQVVARTNSLSSKAASVKQKRSRSR